MITTNFYFVLGALFFICSSSSAQKHDNIWLFGYASEAGVDGFGGTVMEFIEDSLNLYYEYRAMNFDFTNTSICDSTGNLLFYTNGIYIANALGDTMQNGGGINPGEYADDHSYLGYRLQQGAIILPLPDTSNIYYLLHTPLKYPSPSMGYHSDKLYYTVIDMGLANGYGGVVEKNKVVLDEPLFCGGLTATRHANGRDWWILVSLFNSPGYYRLLLTPNGIENYGIQQIGNIVHGLGQAVFSPDGSKFGIYSLVDINTGNDLNIYDFDRCTGELSYPVIENIIDTAWSGGISISANSRYLYVSSFDFIYQYDLYANDVLASKDTVANYDGFEEEGTNGILYPTRFFLAQLGPDGKIYINSPGSVSYLHVINHPDSAGLACEVLQHHVHLPTKNNSSLPNFPNYRLGVLEGSLCDTIPFPAPPMANFICAPDTISGFLFQFMDASSDNTTTWLWGFGDNTTSTETNPVHLYSENGSYEVCLIAGNDVGSDTICKTLDIQVVGANNISEGELFVYPNPARDMLYFRHAAVAVWEQIELLDITGHQIKIAAATNQLSVKEVPDGMYILRLRLGERTWLRRVVMQR